MKKDRKTTNVVRGTAVAVCVLALGAGAMSYFTDYKSADTTQTHAGTVEATLDLKTKDMTVGMDGESLGIINPGDITPFNFDVTNTGEKSIDIKPVITITSSQAMNPDDMEFKIVKTSDGSETLIETNGEVVMSNGNKTATYTLKDYSLAGSVEKDQTKDGNTATTKAHTYFFMMDKDSKNNMQSATVDIKVEMYGKQHRNTQTDHVKDSDWKSIVEEKTSL